jgi:hypothetical protein
MNNPNEQGRAAWRGFLAVRFAWGKDPKNPYTKGTVEHEEWRQGYTAAESAWFGQ